MNPPLKALSRRAALTAAAQAAALLAAACTSLPPAAPATTAGALASGPTPPAPTPPPATPDSSCLAALPAVVRPTPIPYPGYTAVEPSTGLHVTAQPRVVEADTYRLAVTGKVARALSLTYAELRCLPKVAAFVTIECPGFFVDQSNLAGASLASVLALAGPLPDAERVLFKGIDGRENSVLLPRAQAAESFLAYEWEGEPLPVSHGFPVRAALPGQIGGSWVKWLLEIEVS